MLRSLLVGLIAISVAPACKGGSDAPAVQPGVTAGKVIESEGKVTATRQGATRVLTAGSEISGDDLIQTDNGASVRIWISRNNATWTLEGGRQGKVADSAAWTAARVDHPPAGVDEATIAAGRHAEKSAADTSASAGDGAASDQRAKNEVAPAPGSAPTTNQPSPGSGAQPEGGESPADDEKDATGAVKRGMAPRAIASPPTPATTGSSTTVAPAPAPPPPPPQVRPLAQSQQMEKLPAPQKDVRPAPKAAGEDVDRKQPIRAADDDLGGSVSDKAVANGITIASLVPDQKLAMAKCLEKKTKITILVTKSIVAITGAGVSDTVGACLSTFGPKFVTAAEGRYTFELSK
ncbi:MAG TPA: hypothetical protein VGM90_36010 [Kofleriaceae bacterium]|jgi:hypothetical protein